MSLFTATPRSPINSAVSAITRIWVFALIKRSRCAEALIGELLLTIKVGGHDVA